jgi:hypothetical protein
MSLAQTDLMPNPHGCAACEPLRADWTYCPFHEAAIQAIDQEGDKLDSAIEDAEYDHKKLLDSAEDISGALTGGNPGVPDKLIHREIAKYRKQKLKMIETMAELDAIIDLLSLQYATVGKK